MIVLFFYLISFANSIYVTAHDNCRPTSCDVSGQQNFQIRFPFRLTGVQPKHCGYPGFDLSCNPTTKNTEIDFHIPVETSSQNITIRIRAAVKDIDYHNPSILLTVFNMSCGLHHVPVFNPAFYQYPRMYGSSGYTLFNCSGLFDADYYRYTIYQVPCLETYGLQVYAIAHGHEVPMPNCIKMYNIYNVSRFFLIDMSRMYGPEFIPFNMLFLWHKPIINAGKILRRIIISAVTIGCVLLMALVVVALYRVYKTKSRKRRNQQFLEDYKDRRPSRYTYTEVKAITDRFTHKLGQGGFGTVFKGKLANDIFVAVKVLNTINGNDEDFVNEVGTIGKIHHVNVVRLVGYCADGKKRALVYEFLENDSLEKYIASRNHARSLDWEKIHQIALGIAKGIDYLHQGCNQRILHFDIKPQNILLDHNLNPKVADFGLAKLCSKEKSVVTMTAARGTIGYIAPEVFSRNFGKVSYKSDIYSFGMLLLDMVGGRNSFDAQAQDDSQIYFPEWMYNQLDKEGDLGGIQIDEGDESLDIVKRLIIVGLWCIQWYPAGRPSTKVVIQMLEGENLPDMPPNPFAASDSAETHPSIHR